MAKYPSFYPSIVFLPQINFYLQSQQFIVDNKDAKRLIARFSIISLTLGLHLRFINNISLRFLAVYSFLKVKIKLVQFDLAKFCLIMQKNVYFLFLANIFNYTCKSIYE